MPCYELIAPPANHVWQEALRDEFESKHRRSFTDRPPLRCGVPASLRKLGALSLLFEHGPRNRRNV